MKLLPQSADLTLPPRPLRRFGGAAIALAVASMIVAVFAAIVVAAAKQVPASTAHFDLPYLLSMTTLQAALSTVLSLAVGVALAWSLNRLRFAGRGIGDRALCRRDRDAGSGRCVRSADRLGSRWLDQLDSRGAVRHAPRPADLWPRGRRRGACNSRWGLCCAHPPCPPRHNTRARLKTGAKPCADASAALLPSSIGRRCAARCPVWAQ